MDPEIWPPAHCAALKKYVVMGRSFAEIADAINAEFEVNYSRSATIGRARRMGLMVLVPARPQFDLLRARRWIENRQRAAPPTKTPTRQEPPVLRCVEVNPRRIALVELEHGDCRYPYGGDTEGEAIAFCGHRRRQGSSYCTPHFHLTRESADEVGRTVSNASLRLVGAV